MSENQEYSQSRTAKIGWVILLALSALLVLAGIFWFIDLPNLAMENIAERTRLPSNEFRQGEVSAFDVITIITRQYATGYAALGLLAFLVALEGYRHGTRWAWIAMWVLVAAVAAIAVNYTLVGGLAASLSYFAAAAVALVGQLLILGGQTR